MFRPVFLVTVCAAGAAALQPSDLAFARGHAPLQLAGPLPSGRTAPLRKGAVQLRAAGDDKQGWLSKARKSVSASLFSASIALSVFSGVVPVAPVHAEIAPEANIAPDAELFAPYILTAEDGTSAAKVVFLLFAQCL